MEQEWLEGIISIEAALAAGSREITGIYMRPSSKRRYDRNWQRLEKTAVSANIPIEQVDDEFIEARTGGKSHGGVIASVGPRRFVELADLAAGEERPFVVMLDGIEDPFNFGQAVRSLYAAGAQGVVLRPRNWLSAAGIVARSSAGASERMPMAIAETAETAADFFRRQGVTIACTGNRQSTSLYHADLTVPLFLLLGGEKRGITRSFLAEADLLIQIPYHRSHFKQSLGVAAAAAILGFEIMRQRLA